eukprot:3320908-Alexandrium_andersonii.AAC.1
MPRLPPWTMWLTSRMSWPTAKGSASPSSPVKKRARQSSQGAEEGGSQQGEGSTAGRQTAQGAQEAKRRRSGKG